MYIPAPWKGPDNVLSFPYPPLLVHVAHLVFTQPAVQLFEDVHQPDKKCHVQRVGSLESQLKIFRSVAGHFFVSPLCT